MITTDFFTPVVDDAYDYGSIAAANALSDLYAMGAKPFLALNIAAMPPDLPAELVAEIFRGGAEKVREAGAVVAGGHTIQDKEPKFGLVALGFAVSDQLLTKGGARPGDRLVLTKPLGTGIIATALKRESAEAAHVAGAVRWMKRLNAAGAQLAQEHAVRAATDITGFSLLGHASEMASAAGVRFEFHLPNIPLMPGALEYLRAGYVPGGSADNKLYFEQGVRFASPIDEGQRLMLFDAQTSGGLLLAVPEARLAGLLRACREQGEPAWVIGQVFPGEGIDVRSEIFEAEGGAVHTQDVVFSR